MNTDESLIEAIEENDIAAVKAFLTDGLIDFDARIADMENRTLLAFAAQLGHVEIVALLLDEIRLEPETGKTCIA